MVKVDMTRDYYGDLELQPTAELADIKKQFKKLALTWHPDRNPGKESQVIPQFQKIQSAHEVLSDPLERAKYDAHRKPDTQRNGYQGASGVRGNPWSNAGSQWAPPPKPPGSTPRRPPPPSAGAARYSKFETSSKASTSTANEGPEARKKTYQAWENMRGHETRPSANVRRDSNRPPPPTRDYTTPSGREESNSFKHAPPPKTKPGYDEFRANFSPNVSPHRRAQSSGASNRKGFTPATPGGDEPAAPKGAYFTQHKSQYAPEPPPRAGHASTHDISADRARDNVQPDPLRQFKQQDLPAYNPRHSTPYQTHGGEKLNPFDSANLNRSKSHREPTEKSTGPPQNPRTESNPSLPHPHRTRSFAEHDPTATIPTPANDEAINSSSSEDSPQDQSSTPRKVAQPKYGFAKDGSHISAEHRRKPSLSEFRDWYRDARDHVPPHGSTPKDPSSGSGQTNTQPPAESNMYGTHKSHSSASIPVIPSDNVGRRASEHSDPAVKNKEYPSVNHNGTSSLFPEIIAATSPVKLPSGVVAEGLNSFEAQQHRLVALLISKRQASGALNPPQNTRVSASDDISNGKGKYTEEPASVGSPSKKQKYQESSQTASFAQHHAQAFPIYSTQLKARANDNDYPSSFSFKVDDNTFATTKTQRNGFHSASAENINTTFTPEAWDGKFEAGQGYFQPEKSAAQTPRGRTQSASRSRGRSPIKMRPIDPKVLQPQVQEETPIESPGETKFTPEEWADTFKSQTFMPPPPAASVRSAGSRRGRVSSLRPTMGGNAAVIDDSDEASDDFSVFLGRNTRVPPVRAQAAPDPMEVDSIPPSEPVAAERPKTPASNAVPLGIPSPGKRPAAPSQSPVDSALKVDFDDLKLRDLISSLNLPVAPAPPKAPVNFHPEYTRPTKEAFDVYLNDFKAYMHDWDLYTNQFTFHLLARKKQNDNWGTMRWEDEKCLRDYRTGLKEDQSALDHLSKTMEKHELVLKDYAVLVERMKTRSERERPRKKTH